MPDKKPDFIFNENMENIFTDIVRVELDGETAFLELGIKNKASNEVKLNHRIIMTVPHFLRLSKVCENAAKSILKQMQQQNQQKK